MKNHDKTHNNKHKKYQYYFMKLENCKLVNSKPNNILISNLSVYFLPKSAVPIYFRIDCLIYFLCSCFQL